MFQHHPRRFLLTTLTGLALVFSVESPARAQTDDETKALLKKLLIRVETLETELKKLREAGKTVVPDDPSKQRVVAMVEHNFFGAPYYRTTGNRFLAARVVLVNLTDQPIVLKREGTSLLLDGKKHAMPEALPTTIRSTSFQIGTQSFQLRSIKRLSALTLPSGGSGSAWLVFPELPQGRGVPKLSISLDIGKTPLAIDLNVRARARLRLSTRRIGPRGSLGLITVGGRIDTVNIGALVDQLDTLADAGVVRSVIQFGKLAPPVESRILSWLNQAASMAGRGTAPTSSSPFPTIPAAIRELHLAEVPNQRSGGSTAAQAQQVEALMINIRSVAQTPFDNKRRVHKSVEMAVASALASAYRVLPRSELLQEIKNGDPLTRPAALACGGGRLATEDLPLLLTLTTDDDPIIAQSALVSLRHFGEPTAVARLKSLALKNTPPLSPVALDSLAASRYPAAHKTLLDILGQAVPASRGAIVTTMARYPRPAFADAIHKFAILKIGDLLVKNRI